MLQFKNKQTNRVLIWDTELKHAKPSQTPRMCSDSFSWVFIKPQEVLVSAFLSLYLVFPSTFLVSPSALWVIPSSPRHQLPCLILSLNILVLAIHSLGQQLSTLHKHHSLFPWLLCSSPLQDIYISYLRYPSHLTFFLSLFISNAFTVHRLEPSDVGTMLSKS